MITRRMHHHIKRYSVVDYGGNRAILIFYGVLDKKNGLDSSGAIVINVINISAKSVQRSNLAVIDLRRKFELNLLSGLVV